MRHNFTLIIEKTGQIKVLINQNKCSYQLIESVFEDPFLRSFIDRFRFGYVIYVCRHT